MKRIALLICPIVLLVLASCHHTEKEKAESEVFPITSPIIKDTIIYKEYVAKINSIQHIELRALEQGYLQNIYVDEGQAVRKGQLLFQIMPTVYQNEKQKADAEVNFEEIEYQNTKSLSDSNIVSPKELALAKAKLDKARAELNLAKTHLGFTEIRAPFDGIIDRFMVRMGSLLDDGELLTTLSDNSKMWVYFNVPESEYLHYITSKKSDNPTKVKLKMANQDMFDQEGTVETIEADFNNETGNIAFRATFPNPKSVLRHGETGNILMPITLKHVLIIPQAATFEVLDKKFVYVIDKDGTVRAREITVGQEMPHLYVVTEGLTTEDHVLLDGLRKVQANDKIKTEYVDPQKAISEMKDLHAE